MIETPGKLTTGRATPVGSSVLWDALFQGDGDVLAYVNTDAEDARRLCAAWNACHGVPTATLLTEGLDGVVSQRDSLLTACEHLLDVVQMELSQATKLRYEAELAMARAAIAEGGGQ